MKYLLMIINLCQQNLLIIFSEFFSFLLACFFFFHPHVRILGRLKQDVVLLNKKIKLNKDVLFIFIVTVWVIHTSYNTSLRDT